MVDRALIVASLGREERPEQNTHNDISDGPDEEGAP